MTPLNKIQFPRFQRLEADRVVFSDAPQDYVSGPLEKILLDFTESRTGRVRSTNLRAVNNWWGASHWGYSYESTPKELDTSISSSTGTFSLEAIRHRYDWDAQSNPGSAQELILREHGQAGKIHEIAALFFANDHTQRMALSQPLNVFRVEGWAPPLRTAQARVDASLLAMLRLASAI